MGKWLRKIACLMGFHRGVWSKEGRPDCKCGKNHWDKSGRCMWCEVLVKGTVQDDFDKLDEIGGEVGTAIPTAPTEPKDREITSWESTFEAKSDECEDLVELLAKAEKRVKEVGTTVVLLHGIALAASLHLTRCGEAQAGQAVHEDADKALTNLDTPNTP